MFFCQFNSDLPFILHGLWRYTFSHSLFIKWFSYFLMLREMKLIHIIESLYWSESYGFKSCCSFLLCILNKAIVLLVHQFYFIDDENNYFSHYKINFFKTRDFSTLAWVNYSKSVFPELLKSWQNSISKKKRDIYSKLVFFFFSVLWYNI